MLIDAEWIAANGDTGAVIGSRAIALQVAATPRGPERTRPRVIVTGLSQAIDPATRDGAAIPVELRPARDQAAFLAGLSIRVADALVPASDVMPADTIAALVTDRGVFAPPSAAAIASIVGGAPRRDRPARRGMAMTSLTRSDLSATRRLEIHATRDREALLAFLEQDRLFAAYAIADMDDAEFPRTRWGMATEADRPVAVVMEYRGISPQHLFVMGDPEGIGGILRDIIRTRLAYLATLRDSVAALTERYRVDPPTDMVRMVVDRARRSGPCSVTPCASTWATRSTSTACTSWGSPPGCRQRRWRPASTSACVAAPG